MDQISKWLEETKSRAAILSEAYRLELRRLWWANLMFVVLPAVFATAAAILAAVPEVKMIAFFGDWLLPPASILAGLAAVLVAIHKALKCDEYQAECLRLSQSYRSITESAGSALSRPEGERASHQEGIAKELKTLTESVMAQLPTGILGKAENKIGVKLYDRVSA
jgi:hypothetical protein